MTTAFAPITEPSPMDTPPFTKTPRPNQPITPDANRGADVSLLLDWHIGVLPAMVVVTETDVLSNRRPRPNGDTEKGGDIGPVVQCDAIADIDHGSGEALKYAAPTYADPVAETNIRTGPHKLNPAIQHNAAAHSAKPVTTQCSKVQEQGLLPKESADVPKESEGHAGSESLKTSSIGPADTFGDMPSRPAHDSSERCGVNAETSVSPYRSHVNSRAR